MSMIPFNELPDGARLWIFNTPRAMTPQERAAAAEGLERFVTNWAAHRVDLTAASTIEHDQFIIVGVDESKLPPSGCSIDSLVRFLRELGGHLGMPIIDAPELCYRSGEETVCVDRAEFGRRAEAGQVGLDTIVFDGTVDRMEKLRAGRWMLPARDTWHARAFDLKESVGA